MIGDCCDFKFLLRSVDGKYLMRFQGETSVFKFFQSSEDGAFRIQMKFEYPALIKSDDEPIKWLELISHAMRGRKKCENLNCK